ncbi:MAG: helix-turn-helix domain-containing protein [Burkholderiales bacterium]
MKHRIRKELLQNERLTLTVRKAAQILGIGRNQAYRTAREGTLPTIRFGGRILVPRAELKRLLARPEEAARTA